MAKSFAWTADVLILCERGMTKGEKEMIIDTHAHMFGSEESWPKWAWDEVHRLEGIRSGKTVEEMARHRNDSFDPTGEIVIQNMDRAGVEKAVACVVDFGLAVPGEDTNVSI